MQESFMSLHSSLKYKCMLVHLSQLQHQSKSLNGFQLPKALLPHRQDALIFELSPPQRPLAVGLIILCCVSAAANLEVGIAAGIVAATLYFAYAYAKVSFDFIQQCTCM